MLQPNHPKFRKAFKGRVGTGLVEAGLSFGDWGLRAAEKGRLSSRQLEASRRSLRRALQRVGVVWRRVFPSIPVSGKPSEVRRGKGKGAVAFWAVRVRPGTRLFEVGGQRAEDHARQALVACSKKLPIHTRVCRRRVGKV